MFSGIIERTGIVRKVESFGEGKRIHIYAGFSVRKGESVSVNGACLTAVLSKNNVIVFDLSPETLRRTNLKFCDKGSYVNLERSLKVGGRISGHFVQGHVLTTLKILSVEKGQKFSRFEFEMKDEIKKYIIQKGFVAIDGISLTVSEILKNSFVVDIIPETYRITNLKFRKEGDLVNFEPDIIVKTLVDRLEEIMKEKGYNSKHAL